MEPMHVYALLQQENAEEAFRRQLEQYFVTRDEVRAARRERIHRLRRRLINRRPFRPKRVELAAR